MTQPAFSGLRAYKHIETLSEQIGPRLTGSAAARRAADYIRSSFRDVGLAVDEQEFAAETAEIVEHSVEILDPPLGEIPSAPVLLTPDTPANGITGDIVYVEGSSEPQLGRHLAGKIVLWCCYPGTGFRYRELAKFRPTAALCVVPAFGTGPRHDVKPERWTDPQPPLTRFWIPWETANQMVAIGARRARLCLRTERRSSLARNVIATRRGTHRPEDIVLIGAHYDTQPGVVGAADNASGVGVMLELARVCAERDWHRTLRFVAWDAEEAGLAGSVHYVRTTASERPQEPAAGGLAMRAVRSELDRHLLCLNLDVLGVRLGRNTCYALGPSELETVVQAAAMETHVPLVVLQDVSGSDSEPFAWHGVPAVTFTREGPASSLEHTTGDVSALIDAGQLEVSGRLIHAVVQKTAAEAEAWPFERAIPAASQAKVTQAMERIGWFLPAEASGQRGETDTAR